jgi:hypothetical protein
MDICPAAAVSYGRSFHFSHLLVSAKRRVHHKTEEKIKDRLSVEPGIGSLKNQSTPRSYENEWR